MARKLRHEDHVNHEAWAIPYGDLLTLLLAFFVVMYAVSSVNEGRYRVLADSLAQAFGGPPKSIKPIQLGDKPEKGTQSDAVFNTPDMRGFEEESSQLQADPSGGQSSDARAEALQRMADAVQTAMSDQIRAQMVVVRRHERSIEVEIRADILFASGVARLSPPAVPVLGKLAGALAPFDAPLRIEGHTDDVPIATITYPSNWELSAARAASVVHLFMQSGVDPARMSVAGYASYRPIADNATADGRNRNRRVVVMVMADKLPGSVAAGADGAAAADAGAAAPAPSAVAAPGAADNPNTQAQP